jgi:drug/metabolite transporter (DMT)-like permease
VGFGVLSAIALGHVTASHAAVVIGLLPSATATYAVLRNGERVSGLFWASSLGGAAVVVAYAVSQGAGALAGADALLLIALVLGAAGYAEGGRLARRMPGWQVISWGVLLALPVCLPLTLASLAASPVHAGLVSFAGLAYVSVVSMFLGFFAWFRGLGAAGVARASQLQLLQPFLTVAWSALLLGERPDRSTLVAALLVLLCVGLVQRARCVDQRSAQPTMRLGRELR